MSLSSVWNFVKPVVVVVVGVWIATSFDNPVEELMKKVG